MEILNRTNTGLTGKHPIKIVQFGEGNFLRAFVDYVIDKMNEQADFNAGVTVVQPISTGLVSMLNQQDGLYTLFLRGVKNGEEIQEQRTISCIQNGINPYEDYNQYLDLAQEEQLEFVISNTTEAGIIYDENDTLDEAPHNSFPAKLTALLYKRFQYFKGDKNKGLTIIPCELINHNADALKEIILKYAELWELENAFKLWINNANSFHNTLVDRIVPGYPKDDLASFQKKMVFEDKLMVTAEVFLLWVIEGDDKLKQKLPFDKIDENIMVVKDMQPYRTRKVRILNGAHTTMVPFSLLYGNQTVKETIENNFTGEFIKKAVFDEINPTLPLGKKDVETFANEVFDRFRNPFIKHQLASIALNSISKFKVRVLPSLLAYQKNNNKLPPRLTYAMACLIIFYRGNWNGKLLPVKDDPEICDLFKKAWEKNNYSDIALEVLQNKILWGEDLTTIPGLVNGIARGMEIIETNGVKDGFSKFFGKLNGQK